MSTLISTAKNKKFWISLVSLAFPIAIQNFFAMAVASADIFMLGYVGQDELSAVSLANQFAFLLFGVLFGMASSITMLNSQYWGKKDTDSIQNVTGIAIKIVSVILIFVTAGCVLIPDILMKVYTNNPILISIGANYLRIVGISYILMVISQIYEYMLRSIERAVASTVIGSSALIINILLNAVFIFGLFGMPRLGVTGVALATSISRVFELLLCIFDAVCLNPFKLNLHIMFRHNKLLFEDYIKYAVPAILNDCVWTFAFSSYSIILGHMSSDMVAASSVATTVRDLFTAFSFAICSAASVMLGVRVGEGKMKEARNEASLLVYVTLFISIIIGSIVLLVKPLALAYFALSPQASSYLNTMLIISSYYVIGQTMNTLMIAGIFRVGGNTRWGLICDTIDMWLVSVPLGFLSAFVFKLPPMTVYFILCLDEFWKIPFVIKYYKSGKWLRDITR